MQDGRRSSVSPPRRSSFTDHGSRRFSGSLSSTGGAQSQRLRTPPDLSGPIRSPAAYSGPIRSPGGHSGTIRSPYAGSIDSPHSRRFSDISGESYVEWIAPTPKSRRASALPSPGAGNWRTSVSNERSGWGGSLGFAMSPMVAPIDIRSSRPLASEFYGLKRGWDTPRQSSVQTPLYGEVGDVEGHREFLEQWRDREIATPRHSFAAPSPAPSNYERGRKSVKSDTSGRPFRSPTPTGRNRDSVDRVGRVAGLRSPVRPVDPEEGVSLAQDDGLKSSVWDYTLDSSENLRPIGHAAKEQQEEERFDDVEEEEEEGEEPKTGAQAVGFFGLFVFADFLDKILMLIGALGAIVNGGALPWYSLLFGRLVNTLGQNQNDTSKLMHEVRQICFYMIGLSLIIFVGSYLEVTCWMLAADRQATRIRTRYLRAVLRQDVGFFDTVISTGEVMNNISADVAIIQDAIGEKVGNFIHHLATFVSGYTVGILKSWKVSLVVFAVTPLMIICGKVQRTVYIDLASKEEEAYFEAGNLAEQALSAIRTVYSFVAEDQFTARYSDLLAKSLPFGLKVGFARGLGIGIIYLVMYGTWALALWYGSVLIQKGELSGGAAIACFFGVIVGGKGLGLAAPYLANFAQGGVAAFRVFGMINRVPIIDVDEPDGKIPNEVQGTIEFQKVDFTYPARLDVQIFKNFSLTVPAGKTVALVGPSGSGKSTAFALLERFYDPDKGSILLDRVDIRELQLRWLRKQIGLVGQEPVLYATTIGDNISYGKEEASMKEIIKAAQAANADSFIQLLTDKYETQVGERGVQLSGGQKQRIAIARAVLKNPKILLLDEATSALDTESEQIVQEALDRMMVKRTTMVIAHRLSTIRNVDLIAVVSNGEVVELGKHEQLMAKGGVYFSLVNMTNANMDKGALPVKARNSEGMTPMMTPYQAMTPAKNVSEVESVHGVEKVQAPEKPNVKLSDILALSKTEIPLLILGFFNAINAGIIFPFFAFIMGQVVYVYFNEDHAKMRRQVNLWASVYIGLGILAIISMTGQHGFSNWAGIRLTRRVREKLFETLLRQEVGWFDKDENTSGAILSRLSADSAYVRGLLGDRFSILFMGVAAIGVGLIICAILNLKMTLVAIAVTPIFLGANYMQIILNVGVGGQDDVYARAGSIAAEAIGNIRTVASFASEDKVVTLFNRALSLPLQQSFKSAQTAGAALGASQALMYGGYTLTLWYGSTLVQKGETNFGVVLKIFLILILSSFSVGQIAQMAPDSSKSVAAAQSVFSILKRKPKIDVLDPKANRLEKVKGTIEFQRVCFSYPARPHIPIFQQFNLKIPSGCTVALVGSSGSGKSTVISLIQRFYDPDSGKVLLDGTDIGLLKVKWLRQQMSLVGQEPVLFAGTIQENILHGKQDATTQEVEQASRAANVHSFICSLADGYDTQVGERGVQLSGGQKQRIAIARAVLKDPKILLLDEATSALDTESEHKVQVALEKISRDRTTVIVAHRLSTVRNADKIAVVRKGEVVEVGTHDRLMEDPDGVYYHLVSLQLNSQ